MKKLTCYTIAAALASIFAVSAAQAQFLGRTCFGLGCGFGYPGYYNTVPVVAAAPALVPVALANPDTPMAAGALISSRVTLMSDRIDRALTRQHLRNINYKIRVDKMIVRGERARLRYDVTHPFLATTVVSTPVIVGRTFGYGQTWW